MSKTPPVRQQHCADCGFHERGNTLEADVCLKNGEKCLKRRKPAKGATTAFKCKDYLDMEKWI